MKRILTIFEGLFHSTSYIQKEQFRKLSLALCLFFIVISGYSQATGNVDLGSEITNGIMTDGCVSSCQPTYCTNQSDNSGNHPTETMVITITGIPAGSSAEITFASILCGSTSGLDGGDDIYIDGALVFAGGSNAPVNLVECVAGGADIVIEFLANRRDEVINVSWISGPTDPGVDCVETVLDVAYSSFTATQQNERVNLEWTTAHETQNDYFEVQHSYNAKHFNTIGKLVGAGNSDHSNDYRFIHDEAEIGVNYYRLKQVDFNGFYKMSETLSVKIDSDLRFSVLPNLVTDRLSISYPGSSVVRIIDLQGQLIDVLQVDQFKEYDVTALASGIYIVSASMNGQIVNKRFMKK